MALSIADMNSIHPGTARLWLYKSGADAIATVGGANFFDTMAKNLLVNDVILVAPAAGTAGMLVVTDITDGAVTTA